MLHFCERLKTRVEVVLQLLWPFSGFHLKQETQNVRTLSRYLQSPVC